MMKAGILALCACAVPQVAHAQTMQFTDKGYIGVTGAEQVGSHTISTSSTFSLYGEQATTGATQKVRSGGLFDVGGAYRVWGKNLLAGVSFSHESSNNNAAITASIPDPVVFGRPRAVASSQSGMKHSETVVHLDAIWMMPFAKNLDIAAFAGPSIFSVSQDTIGTLAVTEPTPTVTGPVNREKKTAVGVNVGVDVQYLVWKQVAVGFLARYAWAEPTIAGAKLTAGGFQVGAGIRYRLK